MRNQTLCVVSFAACLAAPAQAQPRRIEVGAQFTAMRLSGIDATDSGVGGRISWNASDVVALEGVGDFFLTGRHDVARGGRKIHALFGPRFGWRSTRLGLFAKTRAGVARVSEGQQVGVCIQIFPPPEACYGAQNRLAIDVGGVVEIYPSEKTQVRVDVGDIATRLTDFSNRIGHARGFAHDMQVAAGFGVRF